MFSVSGQVGRTSPYLLEGRYIGMKYDNPKMKIIFFEEKDVITASILVDEGTGGATDTGGDGNLGFGGSGFN